MHISSSFVGRALYSLYFTDAFSFQSTARQLSKTFKKKGRFEIGIANDLPPAYKKFWREWKVLKPAAVHFVPQEGKWRRDELTGETLPIQNVHIPLKHPVEINDGIWGGEAVVKGKRLLCLCNTIVCQQRYT